MYRIIQPLNIYSGVGTRSEMIKTTLLPPPPIDVKLEVSTTRKNLAGQKCGLIFTKATGERRKPEGWVILKELSDATKSTPPSIILPTIEPEPIIEPLAVEQEPSKIPIIPILIAGAIVAGYFLFGKKLGIR